jgi:cadmium resistance protein CadD (predicted permease)
MKDGFRWTLFGGLIGIVLLIIASLIYHNFLKLLPPSKFNWSLALNILIPIYIGVLAWAVKYFDKIKQNEVTDINERIAKKADRTELYSEIDKVKLSMVDHKETNEAQFDVIHEFMASIDNKLDILIMNKQHGKK